MASGQANGSSGKKRKRVVLNIQTDLEKRGWIRKRKSVCYSFEKVKFYHEKMEIKEPCSFSGARLRNSKLRHGT